MNEDTPTKEELKNDRLKINERKLAYIKYKKNGILECDICKLKTKNIHRHHEDYESDKCMLLCPKCHGFVKRYNNLKKMLNFM